MVTDEGKCLFIRFKNCTGNVINLTENFTDADHSDEDSCDVILGKLALSIDPEYKNNGVEL